MSKPRGSRYCGTKLRRNLVTGGAASGMRGGLSLPRRRLSGTWEPETPMLTEKPQVEEPRGREYGCGVSGSDCPIVVKKRGNSRGAKGAGHPRPDQYGQLETGGTERLGRKVATFTGWHEPCDWRQSSTDL